MRVLVVDDDPVIVELLVINLELEGHEVVTASNGGEALARVQEDEPDLLLLDIMMPEVDGFTICRTLREDAATADLPIVLLSARVQEADVVRGSEAGADAYITKPFDPLELVAVLERAYAARRRR